MVIERLWSKDAEHVPRHTSTDGKQTPPALSEGLQRAQFTTAHPDEVASDDWDDERVPPVTRLRPSEEHLLLKEIREDETEEHEQGDRCADRNAVRCDERARVSGS